jgi:hypothetical protein
MPEPHAIIELQEAERITREMHGEARRLLQPRPRKIDLDTLRGTVRSRYPKILVTLARDESDDIGF